LEVKPPQPQCGGGPFFFFFLCFLGGGGGVGQTPRFAEPKCGIVRAVLMPVLWIIPRLLSNPFPFFIHQ